MRIAEERRATGDGLSQAICRLAFLLFSIFVLTACEGIKSANEATARLSQLTEDQRARLRAAQRGEVHVVDRPYFGEAVIAEQGAQSGEPLPAAMEGPRSVNIDTRGAALGIKTLAGLITAQTNLPVNIRRIYSLPNGDVIQIPIGTKMVLKHEGALSKALDLIAARMDLAWSFDGTAITFDRMVTKRYSLSLPTGTSTLNTSLDGVQGGGRSATFNRSIGGYDPWRSPMNFPDPVILRNISLLAVAALIICAEPAMARSADILFDGDSPLDKFVKFITGPFAYAVVIIALVVTVGVLAIGGEFSGFSRRMPIIVIAGGIVILAGQVLDNLFGTDAGANLPPVILTPPDTLSGPALPEPVDAPRLHPDGVIQNTGAERQ